MSSPPIRRRTVADVMTARVHVADPLTPFKHLVQMIEDNRISAIPIIDRRGMPIGVVSEADLERVKAKAVIASDLMISPPITVPADAPIAEAARLMDQKNVRRLVVVDVQGRIAGIVSRRDLPGA